MDFRLAGCVILYNPNENTINNIKSYINYLEKLYIIDNLHGEKIIEKIIVQCGNKIEKIVFNENQGIAKPLNIVLKKCLMAGYTHVLTMDQDSYFVGDECKQYIISAKRLVWDNILGIGPCIVESSFVPPSLVKVNLLWNEVLSVITSGNIVDVSKANIIGGYNEKLFIDEVDHEFNYRGKINNFKVLKTHNNIRLYHHLGRTEKRKFILVECDVWNHNYIRKYYMIRNKLFVYSNYHYLCEWRFFKSYILGTIWFVIKTILYEDDKLQKLRYMWYGLRDFKRKKMGKVY